jgi:predicted Zn-dependent protease
MSALKIRLVIAAVIIGFSLIAYMSNTDINPITGKPQRVGGITAEYETALGMQSVRIMAEQYGGFSRDAVAVNEVETMGNNLVQSLDQSLAEANRSQPYQFQFHLLDDDRVVNAFALPGGQIFITEALYRQLDHPGQLAAVLGHEIGHVLERHSSQQMAQNQMFGDLARAVGVASGDISGQQMAGIVAGLVGMKYSRTHELESDRWGVKLMSLLGYHPKHMFELMDILERSAGSGGGLPEFASTHPTPANRREYINLVIGEVFPYGVPENLR